MTDEQDKTLEGLQTAIQMETDGKAFYLKASRASGNETGRKLLESLAAEEDIHRQKFEEIYRAVRSKKGWPEIEASPGKGEKPETIFARATEALDTGKRALDTELEAVQTAMTMENRSFDFYKAQSGRAQYDTQRAFYDALAAQERGHHQVLQDYYEYMVDPVSWFVGKEHPSLDGG
ncbi:MAG: ferritin family protein [Chloroflexi bacterium]|nr:ferritin family protein [Chloroflexota bacterium]